MFGHDPSTGSRGRRGPAGGFWREYGASPTWFQVQASGVGIRGVNNGLENHHKQLKEKFQHTMHKVSSVEYACPIPFSRPLPSPI